MNAMRILFLVVMFAGLSGPAFAFLDAFSKFDQVTVEGDVVTIPVADVSDGKAHFFRLGDDEAAVKFFVVKSSEGTIRAAFDACDVCFKEKKGYSQEGDFMICNNCGMRFHAARINEVKGGCNPSPLQRTVEGGKVVIKVADIAAGQGFFK